MLLVIGTHESIHHATPHSRHLLSCESRYETSSLIPASHSSFVCAFGGRWSPPNRIALLSSKRTSSDSTRFSSRSNAANTPRSIRVTSDSIRSIFWDNALNVLAVPDFNALNVLVLVDFAPRFSDALAPFCCVLSDASFPFDPLNLPAAASSRLACFML